MTGSSILRKQILTADIQFVSNGTPGFCKWDVPTAGREDKQNSNFAPPPVRETAIPPFPPVHSLSQSCCLTHPGSHGRMNEHRNNEERYRERASDLRKQQALQMTALTVNSWTLNKSVFLLEMRDLSAQHRIQACSATLARLQHPRTL
jgi:hypothetical protein